MRVEWRDKHLGRPQRCFSFLLRKFQSCYLPHIFPDISDRTNVYSPYLGMLNVVGARIWSLDYLCPLLLQTFRTFVALVHTTPPVIPSSLLLLAGLSFWNGWQIWLTSLKRRVTIRSLLYSLHAPRIILSNWAHLQWTLLFTVQFPRRSPSRISGRKRILLFSWKKFSKFLAMFPSEQHRNEVAVVQDVLFGTRENVNLVVELYRQGFLLPLQHSPSIRKVLSLYRDWIQRKVTHFHFITHLISMIPNLTFRFRLLFRFSWLNP